MQQNLITYYPTYSLLDQIISYDNYKIINLYIDLKGISRLLYLDHSQYNIVESTKISGITDSSLFTSLLDFLIFHRIYSLKRNININFYIFYEIGESFYHLNIDKNYKKNRQIDKLPGLDKIGKELFTSIIQKNLILINRVFNKIPNVYTIMSENLEADFIPYYLIRNNLVEMNYSCHLVYSNDHDLFQNIILGNNIYQFLKTKNKRILKSGDIISEYLKLENNLNIPDDYYPLIMAILGDKGDNINDKVKSIGPKTIPKFINELINLIGTMDILYDKVFNNKPIFDHININEINNKYIYSVIEAENERSTISKNLKLVSFELLSRYLDNPISTEIMKRKNKIYETINNKINSNPNSIYSALNKINVLTEVENQFNIFYENKIPEIF